MGGAMSDRENQGFSAWFDQIEETFIAILLGLMTVITFANVVARYDVGKGDHSHQPQ